MLKKFVKKIGKGIKKIGKAIGKPFKKLMKTKLGKIVGTIGMMLIGGWMMSGAKAFTSTLWAGEGMGAAFSKGLGAMGEAAGATFSTITDGIKGMFGTDPTTTAKNLADTTAKGATTGPKAKIDFTKSKGGFGDVTGGKEILGTPESRFLQEQQAVSATDVSGQAVKTTADGSIVTEGTEIASGKIAGDDILAKRIGETIPKPKGASLLEPKGVDFATDLSTELSPDLVLADPKLPPIDPKQPGFMKRNFPRLTDVTSDLFKKSETVTDLYDNTLGIQPLKNTNLPKFVRNTSIQEGMTVASLLSSPEEPYVQGRSDMSGALDALQANEDRLYGQMPMDQLISQTSVPSPSPITTSSLLSKYKQAGYVYDTTLLS